MPPESGIYLSLTPEEYKQALTVFYQHSESHRLVREFVVRQVLPLLPGQTAAAIATTSISSDSGGNTTTSTKCSGPSLLDVGAGDGSLAVELLPYFPGGVVAVDCNAALLLGEGEAPVVTGARLPQEAAAPPLAAAAVEGQAQQGSTGSGCNGRDAGCIIGSGSGGGAGGGSSGGSNGGSNDGSGGVGGSTSTRPSTRVERVVADFLQLDLQQQRFDLVLASHMLYQMPRHVFAAVLRKMAAHCAPGGCLAVAHVAPRGLLHDFAAELAPGAVTSQTIMEVLGEMGLPYRCFPAVDHNWVGSREELRLVLCFIAEEGGQVAGTSPAAAAGSCAAAETAGAEGRKAAQEAVIWRYTAGWPRDAGGRYLLQEEHDLILVGPM